METGKTNDLDTDLHGRINHRFAADGLRYSGWREMTKQQAAEILEQHNRWRRGDDEFQMADVRLLGMAIDVAVSALRESAE